LEEKIMSESIFDQIEGKDQDDKKSLFDPRGTETATVMEFAAKMRAERIGQTTEPDWQGKLLKAKDGREKMQIRAAREAWQDEQRTKVMLQQQAELEAHIAEVIQRPARNKLFYEDLRVNDPRAYWSVPVQRQMKTDRQAMGLSFHLKNTGHK
jgi:hypothetical protein